MVMNQQLKINFFAHFSDGVMLSMFGPILPYLAQATRQSQSDFNYIFALRGLAYIMAGIIHKTIIHNVSVVLRMQLCLALCGIFFILFGNLYTSTLWLSIIAFVLNVAIGSISILSNVCLMKAGKQDTKYYVSLSYGIYGIGAMLGPILVSITGLYSLIFIGVWCLCLAGYYFTATEEQVMLVKSGNDVLLPISSNKEMSKRSQYYLCGMFLLYSSITLSFRSWLPSFSVMEKISSKQNAALSVSLYSIFLTAFRFVFILINIQLETLLRYTAIGLFVTIFASLVSYTSTDIFIVFGNSILLGILFSNYCPYLYSLPSRYGKDMSADTTSNTIIAYAMGEAIVSALIGYLMQLIHPLMLFVSILVFAVINIGLLELTIRSLNDDEGDERSRENQINENKSIRELQERALNTTEWSFDGRQDGQEWKQKQQRIEGKQGK